MKKIMFDNHFGLEDAVLNGTKTMTRRLITKDKGEIKGVEKFISETGNIETASRYIIRRYAQYQVGDVVAIAQRYWDLRNCDAFYNALAKADPSFPLECIQGENGCHNKMFVKAEWMPHQIQITDIKVERLQDISDEDCMKEGIYKDEDNGRIIGFPIGVPFFYTFTGAVSKKTGKQLHWTTPKEAFSELICKLCGKNVWIDNPYVFVYSFKLIK